MPTWLCYRITSPSSPLGISLAAAHHAACPCLQARDFSHLLHLWVLSLQTLMITDTDSCFFSGGGFWNKRKSDYFCTLGVGHALNRTEVNFMHVIFCTAGWYGGWKQHFCVPGLETCSLNCVWVAGLKQRRPGLLSSCSWGGLYFLGSSTEKEKEKAIISTAEGVEFENTLFPCHKKLHTYTTLHIPIYLKEPWLERRVGC